MKTKVFPKSILTFILTVFVFILSFTSTKAVVADFIVTDKYGNTNYQLTQTDDVLLIEGSELTLKLHIPDPIVNILFEEPVLSLLCVTETSPNIYFYTIREVNLLTEDLIVIATDITATSRQHCFCKTTPRTYYIQDSNNSKNIHIVTESLTDTITASAPVYQLLNTHNNNLLVFCGNGTYLLSDKKFEHLSDLLPTTPCVYSDNDIIIDSQGRKFTLSNNVFTELVEETATTAPTIPSEIIPEDNPVMISSDTITLPYGTTFAKLYKYLGIKKSELVVYKTDNKAVTSGKLGTGMTAEFSGKTLTVIITGDLTGEGNINSRDLKALMKHISDEAHLTEPNLTAGDINCDNKINTKDLLALSRLY